MHYMVHYMAHYMVHYTMHHMVHYMVHHIVHYIVHHVELVLCPDGSSEGQCGENAHKAVPTVMMASLVATLMVGLCFRLTR